MPRGDRTGPLGLGPMTGRGAGYCAGFNMAGYANPLPYWCIGGRGRGYRHMFYATGLTGWQRAALLTANVLAQPTTEQQIEQLRTQARYFEEMLKNINTRIGELESNKN